MLLNHKLFFVKERVAFLKLTDIFDIQDPNSQVVIGIAKEEPPVWLKYLRLLVNKRWLPTTINVYEDELLPSIFSIHKPFTIIRSKVAVSDRNQTNLGYFKSKILSLGGGFWVYDTQDQMVAEIKGDWKGWNFKFIGKNGQELGTVTKKWAGIGKELFTSADNYMVAINDIPQTQSTTSLLLLAAALSIDIIYKERS